MWELILVVAVICTYGSLHIFVEGTRLDPLKLARLKWLGNGIMLTFAVLLCTVIITCIRDKRDVIKTDLTDLGMVTFTATSSQVSSVGAGRRQRTRYYVKYTGETEHYKLTYYETALDHDEMEDLVRQKAKLDLRVFEGTDGEIYYGQESDTVESYLADNVAWKQLYRNIMVIDAVIFVLLVMIFIPVRKKKRSQESK